MLVPITPDYISVPENLTIDVPGELTGIYVIEIAIKNDGNAVLDIGTVSIDNLNDFSPITQPPVTSLQPGLSTYFSVSSIVPPSDSITGVITIPNSDTTKVITLIVHYPTNNAQ